MQRMTYALAREWLREMGGTYSVLPASSELDRVTVTVPKPINGYNESTALLRAALRGRARDEALRAAVTRACEELLVKMVRPSLHDVAFPGVPFAWHMWPIAGV